jgi:hypothetical protein
VKSMIRCMLRWRRHLFHTVAMPHRPVSEGLFLNFDNAIILDELASGWIVAVPNNSLCWNGLDIMPLPGITITNRLAESIVCQSEPIDAT